MGPKKALKRTKTGKEAACLSCGDALEHPHRRYCSAKCRQELERKLELSVGLLKTLGARYAAFSFTDSDLYFHVLPENAQEVLTYTCKRTPGVRPAQDLWRLVDGLGGAWHRQIRSTGKRYLATRHLREKARRNQAAAASLRPVDDRRPALKRKSLECLDLAASELLSPRAKETLKSAYRREAKIHHPDHGGDPASFRRIHEAHRELLAWMENPRFKVRRGIYGQWGYDSLRARKWLPPAIPGKAGR
jgi:hypothetical protein